MTVKNKKKPTKSTNPNGLAPSAKLVAEMKRLGWALGEHLAKDHNVALSTLYNMRRRGQFVEGATTIKKHGNRWFSIARAAELLTVPVAGR